MVKEHIAYPWNSNTDLTRMISRAAITIISCLVVLHSSLAQYDINNPSVTQCIAAPCEYIGECRSDFNECGGGTSYCNELSIWVPACGGGGTLQKNPTLTAATQSEVDSSLTDKNKENDPTPSPTTAWDAWTNSKNNEDKNQGVIGYTTGKEGEENWTPSEELGWFDKQGWESGNRTNDEDESIFSKYNPFSRDENEGNASGLTNQVGCWSAITAFIAVVMIGL